MLAGDKAALTVSRVAVRVVRGFAKDADRACLFIPPHDPVVRDVAPQQETAVPEPDRALGPAETGRETLDRAQDDSIPAKTRIQHPDRWVRIALARIPHRRTS